MSHIILKATPPSPYAAFPDTLRRGLPRLAERPEDFSTPAAARYCLQSLSTTGQVMAERHAVRVGTRLYANPGGRQGPEYAVERSPAGERPCPELSVCYELSDEYARAFAALCAYHLFYRAAPPTQRLAEILEQYVQTPPLGQLPQHQVASLVSTLNTALGYERLRQWPDELSALVTARLPELLTSQAACGDIAQSWSVADRERT